MENEYQIRTKLAEQSAQRYQSHLSEIEQNLNGIRHNRQGNLKLSEITEDGTRKQKRMAREAQATVDPLERINGVPNFQDVSILRKVVDFSQAVCRIVTSSSYGSSSFGTGFLVGPGLLLTNHHVLPSAAQAANSLAQFEYELSDTGKAKSGVNFQLRPDRFYLSSPYQKSSQPYSGLDFALVAIDEVGSQGAALSNFGHARLDAGLGKVLEGENCIIIQHPKGDYKKIVLKDIRLISLVDDFLIYESDTLPGSSGSMVVGLGTGEIIALHHSAVPRQDARGNWLRKDGSPASPTDPDSAIDWIGNEGVRISRIVRAIQQLEPENHMRPLRDEFLKTIHNLNAENLAYASPDTQFSEPQLQLNAPPAPPPPPNQPRNTSGHRVGQGALSTAYFEVELVSTPLLQADWEENVAQLVPGFISMEAIFDNLWDSSLPKLYYVRAKIGSSAWELAEKIESLPHVTYCAPDEPMPTDAIIGTEARANQQSGPYESAIYTRGYQSLNEDDFMAKWGSAYWPAEIMRRHNINNNGGSTDEIRWWNWYAVNMPRHIDYKLEEKPSGTNGRAGKKASKASNSSVDWPKIGRNLSKIRVVQLDTGYSTLSKIAGGINYTQDYDFIDDDALAEDELQRIGFKNPFHGTRTASLLIGCRLAQDKLKTEGNSGLLTYTRNGSAPKPLLKIIPYRVANSVVLLGAVNNVVRAVKHAVRTGTDVLFMCMGHLPRPQLDQVARYAYSHGIIWVCAAGNEVEAVVAPASYPGTIAVTAINPDDRPWKDTSYGPMVDIAAPGERVYVPFLDKHRNEIMVYGDGTSYATPHVASAAALWKANFKEEIRERYRRPWQVVEAFRYCLKKSARTQTQHGSWNTEYYGDGILDIQNLLQTELPPAEALSHAYEFQAWPVSVNSSTTQALQTVWKMITRRINPTEPSAFEGYSGLTEKGNAALEALRRAATQDNRYQLESLGPEPEDQFEILRSYTDQYQRNEPNLHHAY